MDNCFLCYSDMRIAQKQADLTLSVCLSVCLSVVSILFNGIVCQPLFPQKSA